MRIAAALWSIFAGVGFAVPCASGIRHFARTGEVWMFMGFPTYGGGRSERWGLQTSIGLPVAFRGVCIAEVVVGVMICADTPGAKILSVALLPIEFAFWVGFALPFGPFLSIARSVLMLLSWPCPLRRG